MSNIDLSRVELFAREHLGGIEVNCRWHFEDGTAKGRNIRMSGQGKTEAIAKERLRKNIKKKQEKLSFGSALSKGEGLKCLLVPQ